MNLGIFLTPGDSLIKQALVGQDDRFINYYLKKYSQNFEKVFVFSYGDKNYQKKIPPNVTLLANKYNFPYWFYQFLISFFYFKEISSCQVFRVLQATGSLPAIVAKLILGKKFMVTYGFDYAKIAKIEKKFFRSFLLKIFISIALFFSDKILVTTKKNYQKWQKIFPNKVFYLPNGVDTKKFKLQNSNFKIQRNKINILSMGRLVEQKNFSLLIKAVGKSKYKDKIKVIIIGSGPQKKRLENLAKRNKIELKVIESVPHLQVIKYLQKADIFCLPSLAEGQSKALLEALSCGLACLVSKIEANQEIIKNNKNGLWFKLDVEDLKNKIDFLIKNQKLRKKLGQAGRQFVCQNHDLFKLLNNEIKILKNY